MNKDTCVKAIVRARKTFGAPNDVAAAFDQRAIKSHSGRHRMVNDLKAVSVDEAIGMMFGRLRDEESYDHYGKVTCEQAGQVLDANWALTRVLHALYA